VSPAPTLARPAAAQPAGQNAAPVVSIPFTRASRKKSRLAFQTGPTTLNTTVQALPPQQLPAAGYLRQVRLTVTGTSAGNSATVVFQNDAPFNILQQISLLSANGDSLISTIDGFALYAENKYGAFGTGFADPCADPGYLLTAGSGSTGGSFAFEIVIPVEIDPRDAFGALQNMAANQSYLLNLSLNSLANVYSTAPTVAPTVSITATMEYWSAPAAANANGEVQATAPLGNGSVSLIQTQTPSINPSTQQNIQLLNVGNTIRHIILILRDSSGVRTEAAWPAVFNMYVNNDPWMRKTSAQWRAQHAREYRLTGGLSATPAINKLDNGVYIITDFMNDGSTGGARVDSSSNRNEWLVTGSATALNIEAVNWGSAASSLLVLQNNIRPSSPQAVYAPNWI
jgi:hypothetical protein